VDNIKFLSKNIPHFRYKNIGIYDDHVEMMSDGALIYMTDGNVPFDYVDVQDFKKNKDTKYFFILSVHLYEWDILSEVIVQDSQFSKILREVLFAENVTCIFIDVHESRDLSGLKSLNRTFNKLNIDKSKVWLINNDSNIEEYCVINSLYLNVKKIHHLGCTFTHSCFYNGFELHEKNKKDEFFITLNNKSKLHRVWVLAYLHHFDYLEFTNYSLLDTDEIHNDGIIEYVGIDEFKKLKSSFDSILKNRPKQTKVESIHNTELVNVDDHVFAGIIDIRDYSNSLVNITTESLFDSTSIHITEKSFKAFGMGQIPIILASHNHIKKMREHYDFDFFDDIVNHDYDLEKNYKKRMKMIVDEIQRLYLIKDELIDYYNSNKKRFENNRKKLKELTSDLRDVNFFKKEVLCL
jgi:hypothetical protein